MKDYCFDTSGLSTPLEQMPEDVHISLWVAIKDLLASGRIGVTREIYDEIVLIGGTIGPHVVANKDQLLMEVGQGGWNWNAYLTSAEYLHTEFHDFISENVGGRKDTVGGNDISIIALAHALDVPLLASESSATSSPVKKRIVDVCNDIGVRHLYITDFLRAEGITL